MLLWVTVRSVLARILKFGGTQRQSSRYGPEDVGVQKMQEMHKFILSNYSLHYLHFLHTGQD